MPLLVSWMFVKLIMVWWKLMLCLRSCVSRQTIKLGVLSNESLMKLITIPQTVSLKPSFADHCPSETSLIICKFFGTNKVIYLSISLVFIQVYIINQNDTVLFIRFLRGHHHAWSGINQRKRKPRCLLLLSAAILTAL